MITAIIMSIIGAIVIIPIVTIIIWICVSHHTYKSGGGGSSSNDYYSSDNYQNVNYSSNNDRDYGSSWNNDSGGGGIQRCDYGWKYFLILILFINCFISFIRYFQIFNPNRFFLCIILWDKFLIRNKILLILM